MDYKEKYKQALEKARAIHTNEDEKRFDMEWLFPELVESEDERIKREILEYINSYADLKDEKIPTKWLEWLEKQGQVKESHISQHESKTCEENNEFLTNEDERIKETLKGFEPKFKPDDWIVDDETPNDVFCVIEVLEEIYKVIDIDGDDYHIPHCKVDKQFHLWTIQDAKDGDVLCYKDEISLYKHDIKNCIKQGTTFGGFVYYCCYDGKRFITDNLYSLTEQDKTDIHPATKEQRDTLFAKMKEAGYEWDDEKKELKKIERNPAWSEEDEQMVLTIEQVMNCAALLNIVPEKIDNIRSWLKSLRPQKKQWNPTEKQGQKLDATEVIEWINNQACCGYIEDIEVEKFVEQFKKDFEL